MTLTLTPDAEKVVSKYLREHPDVAAVTTRIVGKTPDSTATAWVRVTELDAGQEPGSTPDHLVDFLLQLDCYAGATGGQPEAKLLARTVRAALAGIAQATHAETVVTGTRIVGAARVPDTDFEPARERVILTVTIWAHATVAA